MKNVNREVLDVCFINKNSGKELIGFTPMEIQKELYKEKTPFGTLDKIVFELKGCGMNKKELEAMLKNFVGTKLSITGDNDFKEEGVLNGFSLPEEEYGECTLFF